MRLPPSVRWSRRIYRSLLHLYPAAFRADYADEMTLVFTALCHDTYRERGRRGLIVLWLRSLADLAASASAERMREQMDRIRRNRRGAVVVLVALLVSALLSYVNLHNDEVQLPLAILLLSTFALGCLKPSRAWVWAAIVTLGIPVSSLLSLKIGVFYPCRPGHPYSCEPMTLGNALSTFVLVVPGLASAYLGVLASRVRQLDSAS